MTNAKKYTYTVLKAGFLSLAVFVLCLSFTQTAIAGTVGNWYEQDPFAISAFVNTKGYSIPSEYDGAGAMHYDNATAKKICQLAGFDDVQSMNCLVPIDGGRCGFYSCHDNVLATWNSSTNTFDIANACTAGNKFISSLVCKNNTPVCTTHSTKQCSGNDVYWYNSCGTKEDVFQQCTSNQVCQNAQCVNIACSTNSQCGTNAYTGSPYCQGNNVYQNYKTFTCNNPGTANSSCSNSTAAKLKNTCTGNQECSNGQCINQTIACSTNSQCGTNAYTGSPYCQGNNVYQNYKTYTCNNPGTANSYCSNNTAGKLKDTCTGNQTCANGSCVNQTINCCTNAQCGTNAYTGSPYCQGNNVYQNYKTFTCHNPGTANSYCSENTAGKLKNTCTGNQECSNGQCINQTIACSTNSQCGTNAYTGSPFCQGNNVYQNYITYTCNSAGTPQSYCSNNTAGKLKTTCTSNQTCANGQCINQTIACSTNSQCGTNAYTGSPYCQGNNVYQNYKTFTCHNPGTPQSYCSDNTAPQLKTTCTSNQNCSGGQCVDIDIECCTNEDCGTSDFIGDPFCRDNDVYKNYKTYTCNNPGTAQSACSNHTLATFWRACGANQTCTNGSCTDQTINCSTNSQCGTNAYTGSPYCQGNNVYQNYKTFTCNNAGTANSYCSENTAGKLKDTCTGNQTCTNGSCTDQTINCSTNSQCGTNAYTGSPYCQGNNVYQNYITYTCNSAGTPQSYCSDNTAGKLKTTCTSSQTCANGSCADQDIACDTNTDCGTNAYTGSPYCQGNNVYQNYKTFTCNNAGTANSYCSENTAGKLKDTCTGNQTCSNGSCGTNCTDHSYQQCSGNYLYWYDSCGNQQDSQYCQNGCSNNSCSNYTNASVQTNAATNVYNNQATLNGYLYTYGNNNNCTSYVWFQYGPSTSYGTETTHQSQNYNYTGSFSQNVNLYNSYSSIYHFRAVAQLCNGNTVYGQDMTFTAGSTGNLLTINKTARNLTSGNTGFSNTIYANPSDTLMFMITLQATSNQDVQNVYVRDLFPGNLIYKNQLVVSGSSNYSGDITSGITLNTVYAGQTVTITYQAQVAPAQNFSYGTTTLNNSVSVTSSGSGYNPTSNASIIVNRSAVYGASSISTGLTNNFLVDSFLLPLLVALIGIWMWRSGVFFGIERWLDNKKKVRRGYKAEKELSARIATIKNLEKI
jgi:hypothetical protein